MWTIAILCLELACQPLPTTLGSYPDQASCERAMERLFKQWKPARGAYTFNCYERF